MNDFRLEWMKDIVYRFLSIDHNDKAFEELLERDDVSLKTLDTLFSDSKETQRCIFFYFIIVEKEIEKQDNLEELLENLEASKAESSESSKMESDEILISDIVDEKIKEETEDQKALSDALTEETMSMKDTLADKNETETENFIEEDYKSQKSTSQTFLKEIIKKVELHLSVDIPKQSLTQSYVYFLLRKLEFLPTCTTYEEASELMPEYFEFGYINQHPLVTLNQVVSNIYLPLFQDEQLITKILPENCKLQSKQVLSLFSEFNQETKEFIDSTNEAIHQIEKPFVFKLPDIPSSCIPEELAQEAQFVAETQELVFEWITVITDLLEECSQKEISENDLLSEIEFWKSQKFKLSTYFDQLSHSAIQKSINILQLANCNLLEFHSSVSKIEDRLVEVIDIVKYLMLLENNIQNFLSGATTDEAQKSLSDLCIVLKVMWIQSSYYKEVPNMCRIIRGVSVLLMNKVKKDAEIQFLFRKPLDEVRKIANDSIQILTCWTDLYEAQCKDLKKYGGCHWWRFDVRLFFDETNYMIEICRDLNKIAETLQQLKNIFNTNLRYFAQDIEGLRVLEIRIFGMTSRMQYAGFDIFDPKCKLDWNLIVNAFYRDVKNFEDEVKNYISKMFHSLLSWENAYILTESFYKVFLSPSIKQFIDKSHDNMIKQFLREIYETENEFLTYEDEPPCFENVPPTASAIMWVEELLSKLTHPMSHISARPALSKKEIEVQEHFRKTELLFKTYEIKKYEAWKITASENLNKFLHAKLLQKRMKSITYLAEAPSYQVNFPLYLEEVSIEAKLLEYLGYDIPVFIKNILLQEKIYCDFRNELKLTLQNLETAVSGLKEEEIHILTIPTENLCSILDLGVNNVQWDSYEVPEFLKKMKQATDVYRGVVTEIKNVILEINKQIKLLSDTDLLLFPNIDTAKIPTCEVYFENIESKMERKVTRIVNIHSFLETLLKSLEKITSKTTTKEAKYMRKYYLHCEEKILISLIEMMLSNLEYLKDEVLQYFVFPYVRAAFNSEDELVIASLTRIKLVFVCFIKNIVESTRRIIRWMDGTCIKSQPFHLKDGKQKMEFSFYLDISLHPKIKDLVLKILFDFFTYVDELNATKEKLNNNENSSLIMK